MPAPRVVVRTPGLRKGTDGYMSSLMSKLPGEAAEVEDAEREAYLELLTAAMADGQITRDEAQTLGRLAGQIGLSQGTITGLNERFLEQLRDAAFEDDVLTVAELRHLKRAAKALGVATYFDDLGPTATADGRPSSRTTQAEGASVPRGGRKCGHCGHPGHYRPTCPDLVSS